MAGILKLTVNGHAIINILRAEQFSVWSPSFLAVEQKLVCQRQLVVLSSEMSVKSI